MKNISSQDFGLRLFSLWFLKMINYLSNPVSYIHSSTKRQRILFRNWADNRLLNRRLIRRLTIRNRTKQKYYISRIYWILLSDITKKGSVRFTCISKYILQFQYPKILFKITTQKKNSFNENNVSGTILLFCKI